MNFHPYTYAQIKVKTFKFLTIFVNLTKDGSVQQFSSQKTITGTDAHLRTAYAVLVKGQISNKNVVAKTFLGDDNKTQEVYGKSQATPAVFSKYFNTTLTMKAVVGIQVGDPVAGPPPQKVWVTICTVDKCRSTHGTLGPPSVQ